VCDYGFYRELDLAWLTCDATLKMALCQDFARLILCLSKYVTEEKF
jgi:hypothetical protein